MKTTMKMKIRRHHRNRRSHVTLKLDSNDWYGPQHWQFDTFLLNSFQQEENAKHGQTTAPSSSANSRSQLGKRKRNFQTPFKKSPEEEEEEARAAKKAKETTEQPLYKNIDPEMIQRIENEILEEGVQVKFADIGASIFKI